MAQATPAGWYPDPEDSTQQRYWDGAGWTQDVAPTAAQTVAGAPVLQTWKTSVVFSVLGLVAGYTLLVLVSALVAIVPMMLVEFLTGNESLRTLVVVMTGYILIIIYAAKFYPSYFTEKPLLKSNGAISFANLMFGNWIGLIWNGNLTKKTKGISNVVLVVASTVACALLVLGISTSTPENGNASSDRGASTSAMLAPAFAPPANWHVDPIERTEEADVYTDAETGASFVIPDTWSEVPFFKDQKGRKAKFRVPGDGGTAFYASGDDLDYTMDDSSMKRIQEVMTKSNPDSIVQRTSLNGVEYFLVSASGEDPEAGVDCYAVHLIRIENGHMYSFDYVKLAGDSEDDYLQTFFSMVASMAYPEN